MDPSKRLSSRGLYTVGWIAALSLELTAAIVMLDEEHKPPEDFRQGPRDNNVYVWGEIAGHNIVIAFLESGVYGTTSAATTASNLLSACPNVKFGLMVGIGAGIPRPQKKPDIRLGDVVVSQPEGQTGGVFQYDLIKAKAGGQVEGKGFLNKPPGVLLKSLTLLKARHGRKREDLQRHLSRITPDMAEPPDGEPGFVYQEFANDRLFKPEYVHTSGPSCDECASELEVRREERKAPGPRFHYGVIASGNTLVKDSSVRNDILQRASGHCLCLEMEAAGLMNDFPCLVIRGICDYADSHKNDQWQPYAAATASAYARELLHFVPREEVERAENATELMQEISTTVKEVRDTANDTDKRMRQREITRWLFRSDPSTNYNKAISQRQTHTGQWFLDSSELSSWRANCSSFLWLYGLPGCGKTILSSTIIEHLSSRTASLPSYTVLYYYFDFNDASKQSLDGLLRSLILRLGGKNGPTWQNLMERYESYNDEFGSTEPPTAWLVDTLGQMFRHSNHVMVVIDALDEVPQGKRDELLRWIKSLIRGPVGNVSLIVTSRREQDIETALCDLNATAVDLSRDAVSHDIMAYIRSSIRDGEKYPELVRRWRTRPDVRMEIEKTLGEKADGMFRWAACQLDAIRDCYDLPSLRETLQSLPTTLDETYERIISSMSEHQRSSAVRLLQLLTFAERPLRICEAVDAYAVNPSQNPAFLTENKMPNPFEIVRVCASLVTFGKKGSLEELSPTKTSLQLAHFSVKEYMTSNRLRPQHLQVLFERVKAHASIVKISLGYMMSTLAESTFAIEIFGGGTTLVTKAQCHYPFLKYASTYWISHAKVSEQEEEASQMIDHFFKHPTAYRSWVCDLRLSRWKIGVMLESGIPNYNDRDWDSLEDCCSSLDGNSSDVCSSEDPEMSSNDETRSWNPHPLQICIYFRLSESALRQIKHLVVFWREPVLRGVNERSSLLDLPFLYMSSRGIRMTSPLYLSVICGDEATINALITHGVSVTEEGGRFGTALEGAHMEEELEEDKEDDGETKEQEKWEMEKSAKIFNPCTRKQRENVPAYIYKARQRRLRMRFDAHQKPPSLKARISTLLFAICSNLEDGNPSLDTALRVAFISANDDVAHRIIRKGAKLDEIARYLHTLANVDSALACMIRVLVHEKMEVSFFDTLQRVHKDGTSLLYKADVSIMYHALVLGSTSLISLSGASEDPIARLNSDLYQEKVAPASFINKTNRQGRTALHFHARFGDLDVVSLLLRSGADVNGKDHFGNTPIHEAAAHNRVEVLKLLVQNGGDLGSKDDEGLTAYKTAMESRYRTPRDRGPSTDVLEWIKAEHPSYAGT